MRNAGCARSRYSLQFSLFNGGRSRYRDVLFEYHLKFGIPPVLVIQLGVYDKVDRLLAGLTANRKEQLLDGIQIKHLYSVL